MKWRTLQWQPTVDPHLGDDSAKEEDEVNVPIALGAFRDKDSASKEHGLLVVLREFADSGIGITCI